MPWKARLARPIRSRSARRRLVVLDLDVDLRAQVISNEPFGPLT